MKEQLLNEDGQPLAGRRNGSVLGQGRPDDYAFLLWGALELLAARAVAAAATKAEHYPAGYCFAMLAQLALTKQP